MSAADAPKGLPSFASFLESVQAASFDTYSGREEVQVRDQDAFTEMQNYILGLYRGVEVIHSFVDANGQIFDCIPIEQQPALKAAPGQPPRLPPDIPPVAERADSVIPRAGVASHEQPKERDRYGNVTQCPAGSIPMRRITLEEVARSQTVRHYHQKGPVKGRHPYLSGPDATSAMHKYAHARQDVANIGGHSYLNIWRPTVTGNQIFSLSQHWYAGGSSASLQTVEAGWIVWPARFGTNPVSFIYWTADNYVHTGCWNLDCPAFIQTNGTWTLGGALTTISTPGGTQYDLEIAWYLYQDNWWLYVNGTGADNAIGYYPAAQYGSGALARNAASIDYGGETLASGNWPPMGSGAFASSAYGHAAYQREIYYITTAGRAALAGLTPVQNSPSCYTIQVTP